MTMHDYRGCRIRRCDWIPHGNLGAYEVIGLPSAGGGEGYLAADSLKAAKEIVDAKLLALVVKHGLSQ